MAAQFTCPAVLLQELPGCLEPCRVGDLCEMLMLVPAYLTAAWCGGSGPNLIGSTMGICLLRSYWFNRKLQVMLQPMHRLGMDFLFIFHPCEVDSLPHGVGQLLCDPLALPPGELEILDVSMFGYTNNQSHQLRSCCGKFWSPQRPPLRFVSCFESYKPSVSD